ncbi:FTR1 family protein [Alcanivorax jadensis]|uniref:FTR1 family protein n=1 Tax=Alcanivorax jadensis TaxID=64988 RepID=UPI0026EA4837|nr:FTR1 family protein [Alcanivorax jadensis]
MTAVPALGRLAAVLTSLLFLSLPALANNQTALVQLVEYVGADYINAVVDGEIVSPEEYAEMEEFTALLAEGVVQLPDADGKQGLQDQADALQQAVIDKAAEPRIKELAQSIRATLVTVYGIPVSPKAAPDLERAAELYQTQCAACHGAEGRGDGPAGAAMEPAPTDFTEVARYNGRSLLGLHTTITQGVDGTGMAAYGDTLSDKDRWALAFYVGAKAVSDEMAETGKAAFNRIPGMKTSLTLDTLVAQAPEDALKEQGEQAYAALGYLRREPSALFNENRFIALSDERLKEAELAYRNGDGQAARSAALSAYLDGFEMIEQQLAAVDGDLMRRAEADFMAVREAIDRSHDADIVSERVATARASLAEAADALSGDGLSPAATFSASFFILFREGLEALLVVAALLTFTRKANAVSATRHIHLGWIAALVAGGLTWYAANSLITFSGASREMTEGVAGVVAALILFYVGFWMHNNSHSQKWLGYIRNKVDDALGSGTIWVLTFVSFISVYREIFETILFYQALWSQVTAATQAFLFYGIGVAVAALALVCFLFFRIGMTLPLSLFFRVTSLVLLVLSVVLLGRGIAALQEAGVLNAYYLGVPTIEWLGFFPTMQGVMAQVLAVLLGVVLWLRGNKQQA